MDKDSKIQKTAENREENIFGGEMPNELEETQENALREHNFRVCNICKKRFSSGKALGGHMRVHAQKENEVALSKIRGSNFKKTVEEHFLGKKISCFTCGKDFPSMKSLFGHMRSHPDRNWRGIQPPLTRNSDSSTLSVTAMAEEESKVQIIDAAASAEKHKNENPVVNLVQLLSSTWELTGKRRRISFPRSDGYPPFGLVSEEAQIENAAVPEEAQIENATRGLMILADAVSLDLGSSEDEKTCSDNLAKRGKEKGKGKAFIQDYVTNGYSSENSENPNEGFSAEKHKNPGDVYDAETTIANLIMKKFIPKSSLGICGKTKKRKFKDLNTMGGILVSKSTQMGGNGNSRYKCSICDRTFPTYQALGGHRSKCNKIIVKTVLLPVEESVAEHVVPKVAVEADEYFGSPPTTDPIPNPNHTLESYETEESEKNCGSELVNRVKYRCEVCGETFSSGQALGGHKRRHWTSCPFEVQTQAQVEVHNPSSHVPYAREASSHTSRKESSFDLNKAPPMEEDEDVSDTIVSQHLVSFQLDLTL